MKLKEAIDLFVKDSKLKGRKSLSTVKNYERYLNEFLAVAGNIEVESINLDLIDKLQRKITGLAPSTQSYYLIALRVFLKYLRVRLSLDCLDPEKIELPKLQRKIMDALSEKETQALLTAPNLQSREGIRARAILELLLSSGIRVGEMVKLKIDEVDFDNRRFIVTGKGNKQRVCFLTSEAVHWLNKYLEGRKNKTPYLISSYSQRNDGPTTSRSIQRLIKQLAQRAGIKKEVSPHTCRRTFGARLLRNNVDIRFIKDFLGHKNLETTNLYTQVTGAELEKVYKVANSHLVGNVPGGVKQEFLVLSKENFYKIMGMITRNQQTLKKICKRLEIES